ncbi:hypothetical protein [Legionella tucsonensis]|uniref:Uncharacterized protein n=1 Tax=Legionella tucsonensis TaxID=40335 RepID=A0A0W0ZVU9_9GAMM|nr:hypothetical protein [Legionella tucsonensis]KTD73279.1 hypothetical protein Ltuc_1126 [Legionella tucsonensis]
MALFVESVDANKYSELYTNYLKPLLFFAKIFEQVKSFPPIPVSKNQASFFNTEVATLITSQVGMDNTQDTVSNP